MKRIHPQHPDYEGQPLPPQPGPYGQPEGQENPWPAPDASLYDDGYMTREMPYPMEEQEPFYPDDPAASGQELPYDPAYPAYQQESNGYAAPGEDYSAYPSGPAAPTDHWTGENDGLLPDDPFSAYDPADEWINEEPENAGPPKRTILKPRTRKPSFILAVLVNSFRMMVLLILLFGLSGLGAVVGVAKAYMETAPTLDLAAIDDQAQTSFIYDAAGNKITDYRGTENRIMVSIETMPLTLQHAFVAVEDARFYTHNGVDVKRIVGAFLHNLVSDSQQGGSTITQQLIKNTLLSSERSYKRKIQEAYLAMQLETRYSKAEILESYLNTIYLGEDYYGVKVAAFGYFGKENLNELSLRECAMLAGVTNYPYYYNPRRNFYTRQSETTDYAKITNDRTDYVLRCMYENQFITRAQYEEALNPATARVLPQSPASTALYPYAHYVEYAIRDVVKALMELKGLEDTSDNRRKMEQELRTGGYHVYLALDTEIQKTVEDTLSSYGNYPSLRDPSDKIYRARNSDGTYDEIIQPQAAAVVMDYRTGELKAIVGSRTPPTKRKTLNRAADMNMPVGSSIKPLSVYAPAIEMGAGAGTILYNMPLPIRGWTGSDGRDSWPKNYGGSHYRGPETLRTALVRSDNTAAAYALMNFVGVDRSADFLLRMGVSEEHINRTPFGLALGSSGISPVEMTVAFGVLANGGMYQAPITFLGIADSDKNIIYDAHQRQQTRQVFRPSTAWLTVDILKDAVSSGTGKSAKISGQTVAGKTGTNSDQKGVFFAGMTGWYAASVWIGHDNYKALSSKTTGGNSAAKLWKAFMEPIHRGLPNRDIMEGSPADYGLVKVTTCNVSGQLATENCRHDVMGYGTTTDYWPRESAPTVSCQMHFNLSVCSQSGMLAGSSCPSVSNKGVVLLPIGHPLYPFTNTEYAPVLVDYLGEYAALRLTEDTNANRALLDSLTCPIHQPGITYIDPQFVSDARRLLDQAYAFLDSLPTTAPGFNGLQSAIQHLSAAIERNQSVEALASAMSMVTEAMARVSFYP